MKWADSKASELAKALISVIYMCCTYIVTLLIAEIEPATAINMISETVSGINVQTWTVASENTWPPEQLKMFIPLLLIHHPQNHYTPDQVTAMAKLMYTGGIDDIAVSNQ